MTGDKLLLGYIRDITHRFLLHKMRTAQRNSPEMEIAVQKLGPNHVLKQQVLYGSLAIFKNSLCIVMKEHGVPDMVQVHSHRVHL